MRKMKACLQLNLAKDGKDNKQAFFQHISNKRNTRENTGLLLNVTGTLETEAAEKADILNAYFALIFTDMARSQESLTQRTRRWIGGRKTLL